MRELLVRGADETDDFAVEENWLMETKGPKLGVKAVHTSNQNTAHRGLRTLRIERVLPSGEVPAWSNSAV